MGDIADAIIAGEICQWCMSPIDNAGVPAYCSDSRRAEHRSEGADNARV